MDTLAEIQGRRPQEKVVDIPQEVNRLVVLDMKLFTKCVQCAFLDVHQVLEDVQTKCRVCGLMTWNCSNCCSAMKAFTSARKALKKPEGAGVPDNRHFISQTCRQVFGPAVRESGGITVRFVPICSFNKSGHRLRGARGPSPDIREPHGDYVVN